VRAYNELLTNTGDEAHRREHYTVAGSWLRDDTDGAEFLRHVFAPQKDELAVGFKMMHHHASAAPASSAWDLLRSDPDLHVIHLWREDLLRVLVSDQIAARVKSWNVFVGEPLPEQPEPFAINPDRCRAEFEQLIRWRQRASQWFPAQPFLDLEYERDIANNFDRSMVRVFDFLGIPAVPVVKRLLKLARRTPREQLSNFSELAAAFSETPFATFFR
jgi:hypothetical protein